VSTHIHSFVTNTERATTRINIRVAPVTKKLLKSAAKLRKSSLSDFVLNSSMVAAENVLADQTRFVLPADKWAAFNAALDAPPKELPALKRLFAKPSVFESQECSPRQ
jgi:uncharacterized protein (DUF1778 family)